MKKEDKFEVLQAGLFNTVVCSNCDSGKKVEERVNKERPAGTTNGWVFYETTPDYAPEDRREEMKSIVQCDDDADCKHYLLYC